MCPGPSGNPGLPDRCFSFRHSAWACW
jgi:hypothetical protein